MIWRIVRKELLVNLLSLRFALGLVITAGMMGIVGYVLLEDYVARRQTYIAEFKRHQEELENSKVFSTIAVTVDFPPSPLSMFCRGAKDLPTSVTVSPYRVPSLLDVGSGGSINTWGTSKRSHNPLLRIFSAIDLGFVIRIVLSLFAVLLVFDSFSGEREQGTLPMVMACPVGRLELLAGKFIGALLTVAVPLTAGFAEMLLLWSFSGDVRFDTSTWVGMGLIYLLSLLFLAFFLALGMLLSLSVQESSTGLMYLLLVWIVVAVVIPEGAGYLAQYTKPGESRRRVLEEGEQALEEMAAPYWKLQREYTQKASYWYNSSSGIGGGQELLGTTREEVSNRVEFNKKAYPVKFRYAEERYRIYEPYEVALWRWGELRDHLLRPSACSLYQKAIEAIAGTDVESYDRALRQARQYRGQLMAYLPPLVGAPEWFTRLLEHPEMEITEENLTRWRELIEQKGEGVIEEILTWDNVTPLDLSSMPKPRIEYPDLGRRLGRVFPDVLLLIAFTVALLALTARQALRCTIN